jgi:Uma2 family endonuclease
MSATPAWIPRWATARPRWHAGCALAAALAPAVVTGRLVLLVLSGAAAAHAGERWHRAFLTELPDEAFAVVRVRPDGTRWRRLPHHDAGGGLDLPHLRSALARLGQVRWEDPADAEEARRHLLGHAAALGWSVAREAARAEHPAARRRPPARGPRTGGPRVDPPWGGPQNALVSGERGLLTYGDYEALPADGRRHGLHEGELSVTPAAGTRHQRILGELYVLLRTHVEAHRLDEVFLSPVDCILSDTTVVQPDVVYLDRTRAHLVSERGIEGPPSLVVEVLSPSTTLIDRRTKRQLCARYGVPYYWIVDPDAGTVEAYGLAEGSHTLLARASGTGATALPPFPDLALVPAALWPRGN